MEFLPSLISQNLTTDKLIKKVMKIKKLSNHEFSKLREEFHCLTYAEEGFAPLNPQYEEAPYTLTAQRPSMRKPPIPWRLNAPISRK